MDVLVKLLTARFLLSLVAAGIMAAMVFTGHIQGDSFSAFMVGLLGGMGAAKLEKL